MSAASRATSTALGDRDADVGGVQRRRVVDAVAQVADHVAAALEGKEDPVLLRRRDAREDRRLLGDRSERRIGHPVHLVPNEHLARSSPTCVQTCAVTRSLSPVITLTSTPSSFQRRHDLGGIGQRRVGERHETRSASGPARRLACSDRESEPSAYATASDTEALTVQILVGLSNPPQGILVYWFNMSGHLVRRATAGGCLRERLSRSTGASINRSTTTERRRRSKSNGTSSTFA